MTPAQKAIYLELLAGAYIRTDVRDSFFDRPAKLFRGNQEPVRWLRDSDMRFLSPLLRVDKKTKRQVLDRRAIRALHGKSTLKKLYKKHYKECKIKSLPAMPL